MTRKAAPIFIVILFLYNCCDCQTNYTITRTASSPVSAKVDEFVVPSSQCTDTGKHCKHFHQDAYSTDRCSCECPYLASTFGFSVSSWKCIGNEEVRTQSGCNIKFPSEQNTYPFYVLYFDSGGSAFVKLKGQGCKIDHTKSRFLDCDGKWTKLSRTSSEKMSILFMEQIGNSNNYKYHISVSNSSSLKGSFISLYFDCALSCVLFKIAGSIKCGAPVNNGGNEDKATTQPSTALVDGISPSTTPELNSTLPTTVSHDSESSKSSPGIIVAVVIIVLLVVITLVVVGYIFWKRKRGERVWLLEQCWSIVEKLRKPKQPQRQKKEEAVYDNDIYEEIPEITFVEGQTTTPDRGMSMRNFLPYQDSMEMPSLRRGRKSITDSDGYAAPVEFENSPQHKWPINIDASQDRTNDQTRVQNDSNNGYAIPETEELEYDTVEDQIDAPNEEDTEKTTENTSCKPDASGDGYAIPFVDAPIYNILEEEIETDKSAKNANIEVGNEQLDNGKDIGETAPSTTSNLGYVNKKARRRPPSPPRKL